MAIDIFIPFWGSPPLLYKTVESVIAQTSDDWFLTILDDAYPDQSVQNHFARHVHPRVKYIRNAQNIGIVNNYRQCLALAKQDLVMFLGCDDLLLPNYVQTVIEAHHQFPDATIIQPGTTVINESGKTISTLPDWAKKNLVMPGAQQPRLLSGQTLATSLLHGDWLYWPSLVFRTEHARIIDFNEELKITHDLAFVMELVFSGKVLLIVPTVCFAYRRHLKSASTASLFDGRRFGDERRFFSIASERAHKLGWNKAASAARWHYTSRLNALWIASNALLQGRIRPISVLMRHVFNFSSFNYSK